MLGHYDAPLVTLIKHLRGVYCPVSARLLYTCFGSVFFALSATDGFLILLKVVGNEK